jgi:hypothetical protein
MKIKASLTLLGALAALPSADAQLVFDSFGYADGAIQTVSGGGWAIHSPTTPANNLLVSGGEVLIAQAGTAGNRDDANRPFIGGVTFDPATDNTSVFFYGLDVNFSALPTAGTPGSYFAHLKSTAANEFYARLGANLDGAATGSFRVAIANEAWTTATSVEFPQDLSLDVTYRLVVRLDLATDQSTLWVNPTSIGSPSVTATDTIGYAAGTIAQIALRQGTSNNGTGTPSGGPGDLAVDNLMVGTTFDQVSVVPEPEEYAALSAFALVGFGLWRRMKRS